MPKDEEKLESSPLLSKPMLGGGSEEKEEGMKSSIKLPGRKMASPFHSTVNSEKFDMRRFSDRREEEESSLKIIIYVVLVIIIGVGLALLVRQLISNNQSTDNEETTEEAEQIDESPSAVEINTEPKSDSLALTSSVETFVMGSLETNTVGTADSTETITVEKLAYDRYSTFGQLSFTMQEGLALESVPEITVNYDADNSQLKVVLPETSTVFEDVQAGAVISDAVSSISYNDAQKTFTISLGDATTFRVGLVAVGTQPTLIIDVEVVEVEEEPVEQTPEEPIVEEPVESPIVDSNRPTNNVFTNDYSQEKQYIVNSGVTANTIPFDKTYYTDLGDAFELAFGKIGNLGNEYIPNASAELVIENDIPYIDLTIENLKQFDFDGITGAQTGIDTTYANFVRADLVSFSGGTAEVRIQLKRRANFKLVSETTVNGQTQVLAILIKD